MKYRRKPEIIEAVQWFKMGDHEDVEEYPLDAIDMRFPVCEYCGKPYNIHGSFQFRTVHPSNWVVTDSTGTHVMSDSEFREKYEQVEDKQPVTDWRNLPSPQDSRERVFGND